MFCESSFSDVLSRDFSKKMRTTWMKVQTFLLSNCFFSAAMSLKWHVTWPIYQTLSCELSHTAEGCDDSDPEDRKMWTNVFNIFKSPDSVVVWICRRDCALSIRSTLQQLRGDLSRVTTMETDLYFHVYNHIHTHKQTCTVEVCTSQLPVVM